MCWIRERQWALGEFQLPPIVLDLNWEVSLTWCSELGYRKTRTCPEGHMRSGALELLGLWLRLQDQVEDELHVGWNSAGLMLTWSDWPTRSHKALGFLPFSFFLFFLSFSSAVGLAWHEVRPWDRTWVGLDQNLYLNCIVLISNSCCSLLTPILSLNHYFL